MLENIRLSFQGILAHKMRSFLTMLGIIIGIASIIAIVSTIKGTSDQIRRNLIGNGNSKVEVSMMQNGYKVSVSEADSTKIPILTDAMVEDMEALPGVDIVAGYYDSNVYSGVYYKDKSVEGLNILGTDNRYLEIEDYVVTKGRKFIERDFKEYKNVCLVTRDIATSLFEGENPVDKTIEIYGIPFTVVGVVAQEDNFDMNVESVAEWYTYFGTDNAGAVIIPKVLWQELFAFDRPSNLVVRADSVEDMSTAGKGVSDYMNQFIKTETDDAVTYKAEDTLEKARELQELSNSTNSQLIWIASISLLVGGIGVMNIMLVSVTERTREIGLKKALGARKGVILGQFLTEAAVLTSLGGLIGVGAGIGLAFIISKAAEVPVSISVPAIAVSVIFSMVIGILFGLLPSIKASNLNPIDALRYE
ncbi:MAG: ABC transporter permease [Eubacterium sp.]|nr:ABC transporter permease [Eubacterium sp.]